MILADCFPVSHRAQQDSIYTNMNNLSEILRRKAESLHACKKALRNWPAADEPQKLIDRWKENIDFALENSFPSNRFIRDNFDPSLLHGNLIYVDEAINLKDAPNGIYVINGECTGTLWFNSWAAATVYVRHTSRISIIAENTAKVFVRIYDDADVKICRIDDAVVKVYDRR